MNEIFYTLFFNTKSLKPGVYFTVIAHLNSDVKEELGLLDLNLDFIIYTVKIILVQTSCPKDA